MEHENETDIYKFNKYLENKEQKIVRDKGLNPRNKELILRYLKESKLGKTVLKGQKRSIGAGRNIQVAGFLMRMATEWFKGKDLDKITAQDMENFVLKLDQGQIINNDKKPYASETKSNIKKFIRKFYKWLLGNNRQFPELVDWIDTSKKEAEIRAIPGLKEGLWKIIEIIPDIERKALLWVAFDSGFREGELINCRIRDIEKREDNIYYITCRYSKTKPRTVALPYSSELLGRWLEKHPEKNNSNALLWVVSRRGYYKTMRLYSKKALGHAYTVHQIRHTSATFWAPKLDRTSFCKNFGWSYSSAMPDRYIDFAKVPQNKVIDTFKAEKYGELSRKVEDLTTQNIALKQQMATIQDNLAALMKYDLPTLKEAKRILQSKNKVNS